MVLLSGIFVFGLWYPSPYDEITRVRPLFIIFIAVNIIIGPFLTLIVYNPKKIRAELYRDLCIVILLQINAFAYGLYSLIEARPVWLAFEGDRFRVVSVPDINKNELKNAPEALRELSLTGPQPLGVHLIRNDDPAFLQSIEMSMNGLHPAFRPERWIPYAQQTLQVKSAARPVTLLYRKNSHNKFLLDKVVKKTGLPISQLGYFPLMAGEAENWTILIDLESMQPRAYLPLESWD